MILDIQKILANQESGLAQLMKQSESVMRQVLTSNCQNDLRLTYISVPLPLNHHYISTMPNKLILKSGNNQFQKNLKPAW